MTPFPFEAVVFDLDGTLVATERYWPDAARAATLRVLREEGLERAVPTTADWLAMVGMPLDVAFASTFADLEPRVRERLLEESIAEERGHLDRGRAALLAGAAEVLGELARRGVRIGVASNCGNDYLDAMMNGLGLAAWVEEARCLQSPGISNKAAMIDDLALTFGTRSVVMVGDRRGDRDAAWANGFPHVHIPRGYGGVREEVEAELRLDAIDQLPGALMERDRVLGRVLEDLDERRPLRVTGLPLAGVTLAAADLARLAGTPDAVTEAPMGEPADVWVSAREDVLVRRAHGQRRGPGPVEELLDVRLPAARAAGVPDGAIAVDMSNPIRPGLLDGSERAEERSPAVS